MSEPAVHLEGVGKMYKIFPSRTAHLMNSLGLPTRRRYQEFWALRGINLELPQGRRLGILGRNGAGKSTLLKLITGNVASTEGRVRVNGQVQALLEAGAGFHPEFTGEENIRAALTLQGISPSQMSGLIEEIADFTELGEFLRQPFRTYSAGMQARLAFATATAIEPEILIVDEMLSAGDAYFSAKAGDRMRNLVESGASLLLVSHSLDHITMFCEEAIWIDRGRIVERGRSIEVVKSYQQFTRLLDERRIQSRNKKAATGQYSADQLESHSDQLVIRATALDPSAQIEIREVSLLRGGIVEESVRVGDAQDANEGLDAYVLLGNSTGWSDPQSQGAEHLRALQGGLSGLTIFNVYSVFEESEYEVVVSYRGGRPGGLMLELLHEGVAKGVEEFAPTTDWREARLAVGGAKLVRYHVGAELVGPRPALAPESFAGTQVEDRPRSTTRRWPGEGTLVISSIRTLDTDGAERTVFERGSTLAIEMTLTARLNERFPLTLGVSLYRLDGLLVSNHAGPAAELDLAEGETVVVTLMLPHLNLGNGRYTFSVAAFRDLVPHGGSKLYDLFDRSFEFEVFGNGPFENGVFTHPAEWHSGVREPAPNTSR